jgi:beta-glucosidase
VYDIKKEAAALTAELTLSEKVGQMLHKAAAVPRLDIPAYNWWNEALHGVARSGTATMFPQAIGLAAMWDEEFLYEVASAISTEARAKYHAFVEEGDRDIYKGLTFWSPNINIFRDPRWGRGHETYGEDPYLTARLGVAFIRGLQGPDRNGLKVAACAKHFAVHSGPESLRHEFNAECDMYDLWNTYLPAFEAAVREGRVEAVMGAYNRTLGEPCCGSKLLLRDILRGKWGFDGHVVSDCWAVKDFHEHHKVTRTPRESVALAVENGCDVNCGNLFGHCEGAVEDGMLTEAQIDTAVTRLFTARMRLGLLGAPENEEYVSTPFEAVDSCPHRELNLEAARRGLCLLKNNGILPLQRQAVTTLGVIGPNADSRRALQGNYEGRASAHITPLTGFRRLIEPLGARVLFAEGAHLYKESVSGLSEKGDRLAEARAVTKRSDVVVLCLGLDADIEGEENDVSSFSVGGDKPGLELPDSQRALMREVLAAAGEKPVILVLLSGSALTLDGLEGKFAAIIQAFYPGACGGKAIADAVFGRYSPEGKLPVTFYKSTADLPDFCDYGMANRTYRYFKGEVLFPFGFGLGYSSFELSGLDADEHKCVVTVKNTGEMKAAEKLQIYVETPGQREIHALAGFARVALSPGESREVTVTLAANAFARYNEHGDPVVVRGEHTLHAGFCRPDAQSVRLYGQAPLKAAITL